MDIIQSETNRGKNSINFDDHTYRLSNVFKMETSRTDVPKKVANHNRCGQQNCKNRNQDIHHRFGLQL